MREVGERENEQLKSRKEQWENRRGKQKKRETREEGRRANRR